MTDSPTQQLIDPEIVRAATLRLFEHRKTLRTVQVRIGFWPDGLRIACAPGGLEVIPWERLPCISRDELIAIVDQVCGYSKDVSDFIAAAAGGESRKNSRTGAVD